MVIYLDMDGVVSDDHLAFLTALGRPELVDNYPEGVFDIHKVAGVTANQMWKAVGQGGRRVWSKMREYPWASQLYTSLKSIDDVVFLSAPSRDPECVAGKLEWLQRFTGRRDFTGFVFTSRKELLASPGAVLIDDKPKNCEEFKKAGGEAILFPARWQGKTEDQVWEALPMIVEKVESLK
jgi:5'(3')-deoxyribonucleotidase